tara:strand:+ start:525 stop:908 length:384 start_codon:yes stop_codon:yes gene_type:complete
MSYLTMFILRCLPVIFIGLLLFANSGRGFEGDTVVLQGMDKVTARVWSFEAPTGRTVRFGTLEIVVQKCERTPPEEPPESAAYLDIYEAKPNEARIELFHGWMFASSPGLSGLEHPVYDVWVLGCKR